MKDIYNPGIENDLRREGRGSWNTRRRNKREPIPFNLENLAFSPEDEDRFVLAFLQELMNPSEKEFDFIAELASELNSRTAREELFPAPAKIENFKVYDFHSKNRNTKIHYAVASLRGNWGYLLVSQPVPRLIDGKIKRYQNCFYAPTLDGALEVLSEINKNPVDPDVSELKYSTPIPFSQK